MNDKSFQEKQVLLNSSSTIDIMLIGCSCYRQKLETHHDRNNQCLIHQKTGRYKNCIRFKMNIYANYSLYVQFVNKQTC